MHGGDQPTKTISLCKKEALNETKAETKKRLGSFCEFNMLMVFV